MTSPYSAVLDLDRDGYDGLPGWNNSLLKLALMKTPSHAWRQYLSPDRKPFSSSPAMRIGTLLHLNLLEPKLFGSVRTTVHGSRTKLYQAALAEAEAAGHELHQEDEVSLAVELARSVRSHAALGCLFPSEGGVGLNEVTLAWDDSKGRRCKARLDAIRVIGNVLWVGDLKTTADACADEFGRSAVTFGYLMQAAFYRDAVLACASSIEALLDLPEGFISDQHTVFEFVAIEKEPPHPVARYKAMPEQLDLGRRLYERALELVETASSIDYWPGYDVAAVPLELPYWAERSLSRLLEDPA